MSGWLDTPALVFFPRLVPDDEVLRARLIPLNRHGLFPGLRLREYRPLDATLGQNVISLFFPGQSPALMPCDDLIRSRRHIGQLETAALVSDRVIRVGHDEHFGVHPDMASIAPQMHQPRRRQSTRRDLVGERKRKIVGSRTVHVNRVQRLVGAQHVQRSILRHQKNVWNITALLLVEMPPLLRQLQGLPAGNVPEIDNRVGDSAVRPDDQSLQISGAFALGIADLRILGDRKVHRFRHGTGPFHGSRNRSAVADSDDFIVVL
jgi:hypothetical protein